ncbi:hypothetical protein ACWGIU_31520, partial [Streptomyces sp. NPDC054840]
SGGRHRQQAGPGLVSGAGAQPHSGRIDCADLSRRAATRPSVVGQTATTTDDQKTALHTTAAGPATGS